MEDLDRPLAQESHDSLLPSPSDSSAAPKKSALLGVASMIGSEGQQTLGLVLLFVSRIGAGIAGATISTAQAVIADSTSHEGRSRGMALIGAAFGIGFLFGPLL